jgi:hypothetical protein
VRIVTQQTIGDRIAKDFSDNKRHLTDAEQRRLAAMIDVEVNEVIARRDRDYRRAMCDFDFAGTPDVACGTRIDDADFGITQGVGYCVLPAGHAGECSIWKAK